MSPSLVRTIRWQDDGFRALGCPFYAALGEELIVDVERGGPVARMLAPYADEPVEAAYVLRLLGGVHRMALSGEALPNSSLFSGVVEGLDVSPHL